MGPLRLAAMAYLPASARQAAYIDIRFGNKGICMLQRSKIHLAVLMLAASTSALAQQQLERVEVTGTAIKRVDAETTVPVTIIKMADLRNEGITSVDQVVNRLAASQTNLSTSQSVGATNGGSAFANLRGIGQNKTLVLLNGRRIANNALDSSAPDLNVIPFAALDRVEVLRDGASALYGTDAIGGVINFITRKNFRGGGISVGVDSSQHGGADSNNANVSVGFGDLEKDRFNVLAVLDFTKQDPLNAAERNYVDRQVPKISSTPPIGNYFQDGTDSFNPAAPGCKPPFLLPTSDGKGCNYSFSRVVDMIPYSKKTSGLIRGTFQLAPDHALSVEYFRATSLVKTVIAGVPYGALTVDPGTKYYPGNGVVPAPPAGSGIDPTKPLDVKWRDTASGGRSDANDNTQQRLLVSLEGSLAGWDYQLGAATNKNEVVSELTSGYTDGIKITEAVRTGVINPFTESQDAAGQAAVQDAAARGVLFTGTGKVKSVDGRISRELGDWLGAGPANIAVGGEYRKEEFTNRANKEFAELVVASTGYDPRVDNFGERTVKAVYGELSVPVTKQIEVTGAIRHDRYSDFGKTTNPKFSIRFQPSKEVLVRGSYSTGFRAPSLYELYAPAVYTNLGNNFNDPVRCPNGVPIAGASKAANCDQQFQTLLGGTLALRPEKAKNATLGFVFEPLPDVNVALDLWWLRVKDSIGYIPETTIFGDTTRYAGNFKRAPDGSLSVDGSQCPGANCGYIENFKKNLGEVHANGLDITGSYRLRTASVGTFNFNLNSTYVNSYKYQNDVGGEWFQNVGVYSGNGPIFRWSHALNMNWNWGIWSAGLVNHYKSGYTDQNPGGEGNKVSAYSTWDIFGTVRPWKKSYITVGIRNLTDKEPPFSNQIAVFQTGYDPRFADPVGRVYYARLGYDF
jgi:iron complex outermembrane receptor protein